MKLIDAEKIEGFAAYYTEFDGEPLSEREKDLVNCVCKKISTMMPAAWNPGRILDLLEEKKHKAWLLCDGGEAWEAYKNAIDIVKGGGTDGQDITDPF